MVTETDRNKARSAVVSAYHALDCVMVPVSFLHAFADAAVDAVSTDAEPVSMDDEDRTPMPAGFDDALWRKADEVHHAMALVARDQECVKIIYAALSTHKAEPVKTAPAEEIADAVLSWMVKYDLLDAGNEYRAVDVLAVLNDFKPSHQPEPAVAVKAPFQFDRYINGALMAEGVTINNADTLETAAAKAAKIASRGPNGEVPILVARSAQVQDVAGELSRINEMMDGGDDEGSPILPEFKDGWSVEAKVEACLHLLEKRRDVIEGFTAKENWRDDPAQDERWNAGLDFAMLQLCKVLKVDPQSINWDCATETLEGDAQSQIHKVLAAASPASKHGDADHG